VIEDDLREVIEAGVRVVVGDAGVDVDEVELLAPKHKDHGDFATNVALALAGRLARSPREIAQAIADAMPAAPFIEKVEVAGPGFINLHQSLRDG
jgi:arginyl-tRNA synthetase